MSEGKRGCDCGSIEAFSDDIRCFMGNFTICSLKSTRDYSTFLKKIEKFLGDERIDIHFTSSSVYPSAIVPISGTIASLRAMGKNIHCHYSSGSYLSTIQFDSPYRVNDHTDSLAYPFSKIWHFTSFDEVTKLVNSYLDELSELVPCSTGLIEGLEWSLNETLDNVLQHALCNDGYMMGVVHKSKKYISFSIFDNGQGIYNSLRNSEYHPHSAIDAISIAIQEGKTRDHNIGQGNGLWGLSNIVQENHGRLGIRSHGSSLMIRADGNIDKYENLPFLDTHHGTTTVDISFNYEQDISLINALGGYTPSDLRFEDKLDDQNYLDFKVCDESTGFGTRIAGERLRNKVLNYLNRLDNPTKIKIDFSGISIISSSFADEFIGKLLAELGFYKFTHVIILSGITPTIEAVINRSVCQRMAVLFNASSFSN